MPTIICAILLGWTCVSGEVPPAIQPHLSALGSDAGAVRAQAAKALGRLGAAEAVPALIEALADRAPAVRREAAKALGEIKDPRAVPALIEALRDENANVRMYAAYALGEIREPQSVDALQQALDDPEWCARDQVLWALGQIDGDQIAGPVVAALKTPDADVDGLAWLIRQLEDAAVVPHLAALLQHENEEVRMRAVTVLGQLDGGAATDALVGALEDEQPAIRRNAVAALVRIGGDRALEPLKALAKREEDPSVREAARQAVVELWRHEALVAHWSFDDGDRAVAHDVSGSEIHGTIHGCRPVEGYASTALRFGQGAYIQLGNPPQWPIANQAFTVMAWVRAEGDRGVVVARGGAFCGFSLYIKDRVAKFGIQREQGGPGYIAEGNRDVVGRWVHLAGAVRKDRIELYVDGQLAAATETPGYIPGNCGQGMEIGHDLGTSPAEIQDHFLGVIDEVKVFAAALSAEEIVKQSQGVPWPK